MRKSQLLLLPDLSDKDVAPGGLSELLELSETLKLLVGHSYAAGSIWMTKC